MIKLTIEPIIQFIIKPSIKLIMELIINPLINPIIHTTICCCPLLGVLTSLSPDRGCESDLHRHRRKKKTKKDRSDYKTYYRSYDKAHWPGATARPPSSARRPGSASSSSPRWRRRPGACSRCGGVSSEKKAEGDAPSGAGKLFIPCGFPNSDREVMHKDF